MKLYIDNLSKEERKKLKAEFKEKKESLVYKKGTKMQVMGLIGFVVGIITYIFDYINKLSLVTDIILVLFCLIVILYFQRRKTLELNKYALKKARK